MGDKVRSRQVSVKTFVNMTPMEMFPELYEAIYEQLASRELRKMAISHHDAPDGAYTCRACKSKKTQYYMMQCRSADEPADIFVSCLKCNKRWKG
jgi:transcription elongation factor S-II